MIALFVLFILLILYTYLLYPIILTFMASFKRRPMRGMKPGEIVFYPYVSMIISAYNEEKNIKGKIENFLSSDYPAQKLELIIGSDGSTDRTACFINSFRDKRIRFFEFITRRGKISVLNDIVKEAKGEIIIFSDADTIYDNDSIAKLIRNFSDNKVGGVCGKLVLHARAGSLAEEGIYWKYENYIKEKESDIKTVVGINGQIFAVRKELFEPLPQDTIAEDQVLGMQIVGRGYNILFEPEAIAGEAIGSPESEFRRRVRISAGNFQSISFSTKALNPKAGFASFALWSHKLLRWFVPFFLIAIFAINLFLLKTPFLKYIFFAQVIFYLIPGIHYALNRININIRLLSGAAYICIMNLAVLAGFIKYLTRTQKVTW